MAKRLLLLAALLGLALPSVSASGQDKGSADKSKNEPTLAGEWKLVKSYRVFTGPFKDVLLVRTEHTLAIKEDTLEVTGYVDEKKITVKYRLTTDPAAKPKQFRKTNLGNAQDWEAGIFALKRDVLLTKVTKSGSAVPGWEVSGIQMRASDDKGRDKDIPEGFLLKPGDESGLVHEYHRIKPKK